MDIGLLILRLAVGLTLAAHGAQKLFGWFNGPGLAGTAHGLESLGFHPGRRHAVMAGLVELGGGTLFALGLLTPLAAALVISVMVVAGVTAHARNGFFITSGGYEYTLVLAAAALSVAFTGPGLYAADAWVGRAETGAPWGLGALLVGLAGAAGALLQRQPSPVAHGVRS